MAAICPVQDELNDMTLMLLGKKSFHLQWLNIHKTYHRTLYDNDYHRTYHQASNIIRTKYQKLNVSRLVLQLSLPNSLKPGVESRMKTPFANYIWVINNFITY